MKKVVISGSAKLQQELGKWNDWWQKAGFSVLYCPDLIDPKVDFSTAYKDTYERFYRSLLKSDVLFVMNEDKNGIEGYIGAQTFAEASFAVANNLVLDNKKIRVIVLKKPSDEVASHSEVTTWLELKWVILFDDWKRQEGF
jgi:hypothetical protein